MSILEVGAPGASPAQASEIPADGDSAGGRPLDALALAKQAARVKFKDYLVERGLPPEYAAAYARAVVDPNVARSQLAHPITQRFRGGTAEFLLTQVFTPAILPSLVNPRETERRTYAIAAGNQPYLAPLTPQSAPNDRPGLRVEAATREQVERTIRASATLLRQNDELREKIEMDGVFNAITVFPTELTHDDGTPSVVIPMAADGSTRVSLCHDLAGFDTEEVLYRWPTADLREWNGRLRQTIAVQDRSRFETDEEDLIPHRALTCPALLLLRVMPVRGGPAVSTLEAYRAIVGAIHIDPPTVWSRGSQVDAIADSVIDRLRDRGIISSKEHAYIGGHLTPDQVRAADLPLGADERAVTICAAILSAANQAHVSAGYRALDPRKRVLAEQRANVATELILRAIRSHLHQSEVKGIRSTLERTLTLPDFRDLTVSGADPDSLLEEALAAPSGRLSPAALELGVIALYWLATRKVPESDDAGGESGEYVFRRDKGADLDKRQPQAVLRVLMSTEHGLRQLRQAVLDGRAGISLRSVRPDGTLDQDNTGGFKLLHNQVLRAVAREPGTTSADTRPSPPSASTPAEEFDAGIRRLLTLSADVEGVVRAMEAIRFGRRQYGEERGASPTYTHQIAVRLRDAAHAAEGWGRAYVRATDSGGGEDGREDEA